MRPDARFHGILSRFLWSKTMFANVIFLVLWRFQVDAQRHVDAEALHAAVCVSDGFECYRRWNADDVLDMFHGRNDWHTCGGIHVGQAQPDYDYLQSIASPYTIYPVVVQGFHPVSSFAQLSNSSSFTLDSPLVKFGRQPSSRSLMLTPSRNSVPSMRYEQIFSVPGNTFARG